MENVKIIIRTDFSDAPGARYRKDGPHSGEEFLENLLRPKFEEALQKNVKLEIDLDGVWGYQSSFVSGSFGKLSMEKGADIVMDTIVFISEESETRKSRIINEIINPTKKSSK